MTSASTSAGTTCCPASAIGAKRSQSGSSSRVVERRGDAAVEAPRDRVALVPTDDHPADLLAEVDETVGVAHRRQIDEARAAGRSGDRVLVGHRHDRHVDAGQASDLVAVDPAGVDHDLALDATLGRSRRPVTRRRPAVSTTPIAVTRVPVAISTPPCAGAGGERHRQVGRVELAIGREDAPRRARRPDSNSPWNSSSGLARCEIKLQRQPERRRPTGLPAQLLQARRCRAPGAATRPRASRGRDRSRRRGAGRDRCRTSSSG